MRGLRVVVFFCFVFTATSYSNQLNWEESVREPIRASIRSCATFLSPAENKQNKSVGVRISTNSPEEFARSLDSILASEGASAILGGHFFVTGVPMSQEVQRKAAFEKILADRDLLRAGTRVSVLSVPASMNAEAIQSIGKSVLQRIIYFFPSLVRDYERPLASEVISNLASTAVIEGWNMVYLYRDMGGATLDFNLTVGIHTATLVAYSIYSRFMVNWLLRPGTNRVEQILKSALLSVPFVANYAVSGNISKILAYIQEHGWEQALSQAPTEFGHFAFTQGLTLALHVLFYRMVITNGVDVWQYGQDTKENSVLARIISPLIKAPFLALDAWFLAISGRAEPLLQAGLLEVNSGHLWLASLTAAGSLLWLKPALLNPTLGWAKAVKRMFGGKVKVEPTTDSEERNAP